MPKRIEISALPLQVGTYYPPPDDEPCRARERRRLGDAAGLTQFGVNLLRLKPGVWSSQRHWHKTQDEFVWVLEGELVLITDDGEEILKAGDCAGFQADDGNGHHFQNRGTCDALVLEIGARNDHDSVTYPGIDLAYPPGGVPAMYTHRDGAPYTGIRLRTPQD